MFNKNIKHNRCKNDFVDMFLLVAATFCVIMTVLSTVVVGYGLFYQFPSWFPFAKPTAKEFVFGLACSFLALSLTPLIITSFFD